MTKHDAADSDLEKAYARLYAAPLAEFVSLRKTIATELKKAGDSESASKLTEARKPTATAWAANQIAHRHPEALATFTSAIEELRDAQRDLLEAPAAKVAVAKEKFRAARNTLNERVTELVKLSRGALEEAGAGFSLTTQKRITATLHVLPLASAEDREKFLRGRLEKDLDASSDEDSIASAFGPVDEAALGARQRERAAETRAAHEAPQPHAPTKPHAPRKPHAAPARHVSRHEHAEAHKKAEKERMERVRRAAEEREKIRALEHKVSELEREAKRLSAEATKAEAAAARARGDADRAETRADEARERLATLRPA